MRIRTLLCAVPLLVGLLATSGHALTLTIVTNGIGSGTVTGGGTYSSGATPKVQIKSVGGSYIKNIQIHFFQPNPPNWSPVQFNTQIIGIGINTPVDGISDLTVITNDTETLPALSGDATLTVTFDLCRPTVEEQPTTRVVLTGSNVKLEGGSLGRQPIQFQWFKDGVALNGVNKSFIRTSFPFVFASALQFPNAQPSNSGVYILMISNACGATNTAQANLIVKDVLFLLNGDPVTNSSVGVSADNATISIQGPYTNGNVFYTLDGSVPDFGSTVYSGPFVVGHSATLTAIAYSADFSRSVISEPLAISILPIYWLSIEKTFGGSVIVDPPSGPYLSNSVVTVTAIPDPGWTFMAWSGALKNGEATNSLIMDADKSLKAIFGTTLSTMVTGNGSVTVSPTVPLYPAGTTVVLTAIPGQTNYFAVWGNAGSGSDDPLSFTIDNPNPTVSALFAPLPAGQVSLTVTSDGLGFVNVTGPRSNRYPVGVTNIITAYPYFGQEFLGWTGDVTATNAEISVVMDSNETISAHFTHAMRLSLYSRDPLQIWGIGAPGDRFEFQASTNLIDWTTILSTNNITGSVELSDPAGFSFPNRCYRIILR